MAFDHECTLRGFFRPESDSNGPSTVDLHFHWKRCRRVFHRTNHGILPPTADEPIAASSSSHFGYSIQALSEFRELMYIYIIFLEFPHELSSFLYDKITSSVIDFVAESPTGICPSLIFVAEINFVQRVYADYDPRPLEIIPPRQLAASADENLILGTTTEGPEVDSHVFVNETFVLRGTTEGWGGDEGDSDGFVDEGDSDGFFDESFILAILSQVDEDNNAGTEMLGRIERGTSATGGGGEVHCSVCLDEFSEGQEVMTMACNHSYHEQCILTWLDQNQTCPLCRRPIQIRSSL